MSPFYHGDYEFWTHDGIDLVEIGPCQEKWIPGKSEYFRCTAKEIACFVLCYRLGIVRRTLNLAKTDFVVTSETIILIANDPQPKYAKVMKVPLAALEAYVDEVIKIRFEWQIKTTRTVNFKIVQPYENDQELLALMGKIAMFLSNPLKHN